MHLRDWVNLKELARCQPDWCGGLDLLNFGYLTDRAQTHRDDPTLVGLTSSTREIGYRGEVERLTLYCHE